MTSMVKTAVLEQVDEKVDLCALPDADITEGEEPDYRIVVPRTLLLLLGAFLILHSFVKHFVQ